MKMDILEKGSPNYPPKSSASTKPSYSAGGTKENVISHDQMGSKSQNPQKSVTKHFMSPTISATSKVTVPIKKILAEKNESITSFDTHFQKSPIFGSRSGLMHSGLGDQTSSRTISACSYTSESDYDDLNASFADSSLKPYDPSTNYLSPRPKYLRYKPNRRREILLHREPRDENEVDSFLQKSGFVYFQNQNIVDEEKSSDCDHQSLIPPSQEGSETLMVKADDDNNYDGEDADEEEEEEEGDELEEEKAWSLKGLLKFLLLFIVIGLSTLNISSMNSPTASPIVQAIGGLRDGFQRIQEHLFEAGSKNVLNDAWKNGSVVQTGDGQIDLLEVINQNSVHGFGMFQMFIHNDEELVKSTDEIVKMLEPRSGGSDDIWGSVETDVATEPRSGGSDDIWGSVETDVATEQELKKIEEDDSEGLELFATLQRSDYVTENITPLVSQRIDDIQSASENEPADLIYKRDQLENHQQIDQYAGTFWEEVGEEMTGTGPERTEDNVRRMEGETYHEVGEVEGVYMEKAGENVVETELEISEVIANSVQDNTRMDNDNTGLETRRFEIVPLVAIWFSICSIILASLAYIYSQIARQAPLQGSHLEIFESEEKLSPAQPCIEVELKEEKVEPIVKPSSVFLSFEEAKTEPTYIHAPEVELLGELVVGEFSSPLSRSCGRNAMMVETVESINPTYNETSRVQLVAQAQTLNLSNTDSPSYGSFTSKKLIVVKEGGREGDVIKLITTPVRRSSRIRNLTVTSP